MNYDKGSTNTGGEPILSREGFEGLGIFLADHPRTDPGDGRTQCAVCGKWVWLVTHSCKGIRVTEPTEWEQEGEKA